MPSKDPHDLLKTEFQALPLAEVLQQPPTVLLGVAGEALAVLATLGIASVFDLALSRVFESAAELNDAAENPGNPLNRFGAPVGDMVRSGLPGALGIGDFRFQRVDILSGIADPAALKTALGVQTVRDLAVYPPYRAAKEILDQVFFPDRLAGFDPEAPGDLVPKSGEFPTERVQYKVLLLDEIRRPEGAPPLIDLASSAFAPVDVAPLSSGGIFAEGVLGRFNCAEKLDLSRFWNWQDSPIPIQPTDIAAIQTGSHARDEDVKPGALSAPILNITPLSELLALVGDAPIATPSGSVKLADVRRAFAADAELRVFNLSNPLREEYLQALANLFQTRVSGFVQKPVRMTAEVIAVSDEASERVLSRKVDVGFIGDPVDHPVGAFVHLLQRDHPARGGLYTAFPLRA